MCCCHLVTVSIERLIGSTKTVNGVAAGSREGMGGGQGVWGCREQQLTKEGTMVGLVVDLSVQWQSINANLGKGSCGLWQNGRCNEGK